MAETTLCKELYQGLSLNLTHLCAVVTISIPFDRWENQGTRKWKYSFESSNKMAMPEVSDASVQEETLLWESTDLGGKMCSKNDRWRKSPSQVKTSQKRLAQWHDGLILCP